MREPKMHEPKMLPIPDHESRKGLDSGIFIVKENEQLREHIA